MSLSPWWPGTGLGWTWREAAHGVWLAEQQGQGGEAGRDLGCSQTWGKGIIFLHDERQFQQIGTSMFAVSQVANSTHSCTFQAVGLQLYLTQLCPREARKLLCFCANTHYPDRDSAGRASICPQVATCAPFQTKSPSSTQEQCRQAHPPSLDSRKNSCHTNWGMRC